MAWQQRMRILTKRSLFHDVHNVRYIRDDVSHTITSILSFPASHHCRTYATASRVVISPNMSHLVIPSCEESYYATDVATFGRWVRQYHDPQQRGGDNHPVFWAYKHHIESLQHEGYVPPCVRFTMRDWITMLASPLSSPMYTPFLCVHDRHNDDNTHDGKLRLWTCKFSHDSDATTMIKMRLTHGHHEPLLVASLVNRSMCERDGGDDCNDRPSWQQQQHGGVATTTIHHHRQQSPPHRGRFFCHPYQPSIQGMSSCQKPYHNQ